MRASKALWAAFVQAEAVLDDVRAEKGADNPAESLNEAPVKIAKSQEPLQLFSCLWDWQVATAELINVHL